MENGLNRRRFIGAAVGTGAAASMGAFAPSALGKKGRAAQARAYRGRLGFDDISIQLYTLRHIINDDQRNARRVFRALGEIGYRNVELAGRYGWNGRQLANQLQNAGLRAVSSHDDPRGPGWMQALRDAEAAGQQYIGMAYQQDPFTEASYKALAQQLNTAGEQAAEHGLQFFYHNHDFEFTNKRADGAPLFDTLLEDTDPGLVKFQLDLYWAIEGGVSPLEYLSADPERYPLYHVKDRTWADRPDAQDWEDVGPGAIDWPDIFASGAQRGLQKYYVVEHDDPRLSHPDEPEAGLITAEVGFDYLINVRF